MTIKTAAQAIERSISHTEIVTIPWTAQVAADLAAASEDSVETDRRIEYWGTDDGSEWRVHLDTTARTAARS